MGGDRTVIPAERQLIEAVTGFLFPADRCLYCDSTGPSQWDHFPIPQAIGGIETVRACLHCHNMKDRVSDAIAQDWLACQLDEANRVVLSAAEVAFIEGEASLLPRQARHLVDDIRDHPAALRVMIGRRLREQLVAMHAVSSP